MSRSSQSQRQKSASRGSSSVSGKNSLARIARLSHKHAGSAINNKNNNNYKSLGVDPQTLKQRVDSMYHRILRAEVDSRLQAETDRRQNLERELQARATRAQSSRPEQPQPERVGQNRRQQPNSNDDDHTNNNNNNNNNNNRSSSSSSSREKALSNNHSQQQASARAATTSARGMNQRRNTSAGTGTTVKRGKTTSTTSPRAQERENAFQAHRRSGARGRSGPIVRQFRHKHEIVRDAEIAQRQVKNARERLAAEQEKSKVVNAEHTEITEAVHASKQKIKALVSLIRSLALSRTQKLQVANSSKQPSQQHSISSSGEKDAAHIIDDHLDTILDLLPHYERKAQRVRRVVCDDLDEDPDHPATIDELLENVPVPGAGDVPISALVNEAPSKKAIQQQYEAYLQTVFDANAEANAVGVADDEEEKTARDLDNERATLKARIARQNQHRVPVSTPSTAQQHHGQTVVGQRLRRVDLSMDRPASEKQFPTVVDDDEWLSALNHLSSGM